MTCCKLRAYLKSEEWNFILIAFVWLTFDQVSKVLAATYLELGKQGVDIMPFVCLHLIYNTGMAWGLLGKSTFILGCFSLVVCALILVVLRNYTVIVARPITFLETCGLSLVFAGGLGNAIDRFLLGYVIDFIDFTPITFPVFNIADIGVTCGFILLFIGFIRANRLHTSS